MESIGIIFIAIISYILLQKYDSSYLIPTLGALAIAAQRILPAAQAVFSGWAFIRAADADLLAVIKAIKIEKI